jgi:hypothetical protein
MAIKKTTAKKTTVSKKPIVNSRVKKTLPKAQKGIPVKTPKTYNQQLMQKFPQMSPSDTLPERSFARSQIYAANPYEGAKQLVDRENEFNDSIDESRVRSKAELKAMKKRLDSYKKTGGTTQKIKTSSTKSKAAYGKVVKPTMMQKGGTTKKK